jgi:hypothetical protein
MVIGRDSVLAPSRMHLEQRVSFAVLAIWSIAPFFARNAVRARSIRDLFGDFHISPAHAVALHFVLCFAGFPAVVAAAVAGLLCGERGPAHLCLGI